MFIENMASICVDTVICTVILNGENGWNPNIKETLNSIFMQNLNENEIVQVIILNGNEELKTEAATVLENNQNLLVACLLGKENSLNDLIKGDYFCFGRAGDIYTPQYFSEAYRYLKNRAEILVTQYWDDSYRGIMQNCFYEKEREIFVDKNPEIWIDCFDTVWYPKRLLYNFVYSESDDYEYNCMRFLLYSIVDQKKFLISGNALTEGVCTINRIRLSKIPYTKELRNVYLRTINYSLVKTGEVLPFIQFILLELMRSYVQQRYNIKNILDERKENLNEYKELALYCLSYIEWEYMIKDQYFSLEQKMFVARQSGYLCNKYLVESDKLFVTDENNRLKIEYSPIVDYLFADVSGDTLKIEVDIFLPFSESELKVFFKCGENTVNALIEDNYQPETLFENEIISERIFCTACIPLTDHEKVSCWVKIGAEVPILCNRYRFSRFFPVSTKYKEQYYCKNGWCINADGAKLTINKIDDEGIRDRELNFNKKLSLENRFLREYALTKRKRNKIWLIWDRADTAGDNGEALFRYLMKQYNDKEEYYFILKKDTKDFQVLHKEYPYNVVEAGSTRHKKLFALADILIGSQTDSQMWPIDPEIFRDIISEKPFVFLQHGITKNDMSANYSKYFQNIRLFVTAGKPELKHTRMIANYGFDENMVQLLGFPRFDRLDNKKQKYIVVLPTWRKYCVEKDWEGQFHIKDNFEESDYFIFYFKLLSNPELIQFCTQMGYKILLMQHNILKDSDVYFENMEGIELADETWSYNRVISEAALLITDYSSVSFDFAYLEKPVIYCQFDEEKFYKTHTYQQGFFEYRRDGFGPVVYDSQSAIDEVRNYLQRNCEMEDEYKNRIQTFFGYRDKGNCKRVVEAIRKVYVDYERE